MSYRQDVIGDLLGQTLAKVEARGNTVFFQAVDGQAWELYHEQSCCESVVLEDVAGDLADLVGSPILMAEAVSSKDAPAPAGSDSDSYTWTYYKLASLNGYVTIRFIGSSNGYYSEGVSFRCLGNPKDKRLAELEAQEQQRQAEAKVQTAERLKELGARSKISDLLALLMGDGGHYEMEHGLDQTVTEVLVRLRQGYTLDQLALAQERAVRSTIKVLRSSASMESLTLRTLIELRASKEIL